MACECVSCSDCGGSGQCMAETIGYPEDDLEACENCGGSGVVEVCDECREAGDGDE